MRKRQRQSHQQRYAIVGALYLKGPMSNTFICLELKLPIGSIDEDLLVLESQGRITCQWVEGPWPRHRIYKVSEPE